MAPSYPTRPPDHRGEDRRERQRQRYQSVWPNRTILDYIESYYERKAEFTAVVDADRRCTYAQLLDEARAFASFLELHDIGSGDVVSFQLPNRIEAVVVHLASLMVGAIVNPVVMISREHELSQVLTDAQPSILILPSEYRGIRRAERALRAGLRPPVMVAIGDEVPGCIQYASEIRHHIGKSPKGGANSPEKPSYLLYTSGTEAQAKGVLHSQNTVLFDLLQTIRQNQLTESDVIFAPSPVTHITGVLYALLLPFVLGNKLVLQDQWSGAAAARNIATEGCTWTAGATPFLRDLLNDPLASDWDIRCLKTFRCGGAGVPPELIAQAQAKGIQAYRSYGCTEHPTISGMLGASASKCAFTDGLVHEHVELRCVDVADSAVGLAPGQFGEILTRGADLSLGYRDETLNQSSFDADGWFRTGDIGFVDQEGFLTITDRKKDIVIRKGENISAREIELALLKHRALRDAAVVGLPDEQSGERVCAVVVLNDSELFTFEDMTDHLESMAIAKQKFPEQLEYYETLPMTASGKVRKSILRSELIAAERRRLLDRSG